MDRGRRQALWAILAGGAAVVAAAGCSSGGGRSAPIRPPGDDEEDAVADAVIDPASAGLITGTVTYRQRIALPKGAIVVAELFDMSDAAAPARIARSRTVADGQVPFRFQLSYDRSRIDPGRPYAVQARIVVDRAAWFVTDRPVPVLTQGNPSTVALLLRQASARE